MNLHEYQRSRSFTDLGTRSLRFTFSNFFSLETARPIKAKFYVDPPWDGERKFVQMVQVTWPIWPPCPYMVKTLKILLLWNQTDDDLECWYAASGTQVLPSLFKWWPWVDPDLFYGKVKFAPLCFCMELNVHMNLYENQRSNSFIDLRPRSLRFNIYKRPLLRKR